MQKLNDLTINKLRKIHEEVECETSNPCARKFYKVDLQREMAELKPDTSTVILMFDSNFKREELVNDYDFLQFLADSGGAMGKCDLLFYINQAISCKITGMQILILDCSQINHCKFKFYKILDDIK